MPYDCMPQGEMPFDRMPKYRQVGQIEWEKVKKKNEDGNLICHVCQSRFRYSSGWSTHIKTQHGLQARMNTLQKKATVPYVIIIGILR